MALKLFFIVNENHYWEEKIIQFTYINGLTFNQKQKNVESFHRSINEYNKKSRILEVSTKSNDALGVKLSAFNLMLDGYPFECVFQSSKVFDNGDQYPEAKHMTPQEAKSFLRENSKGKTLLAFKYNKIEFPLFPKSLFYDYLYIKSFLESNLNISDLLSFNIFTDIEFNEKRQINCQARSVAILVSLYKRQLLTEAISSPEKFKELVYADVIKKDQVQLNLF